MDKELREFHAIATAIKEVNQTLKHILIVLEEINDEVGQFNLMKEEKTNG
jgi:hypothetical protein